MKERKEGKLSLSNNLATELVADADEPYSNIPHGMIKLPIQN